MPRRKAGPLTPQEWAVAVEMRKRGVCLESIAHRLGVSRGHLGQRLTAMGHPPPGRDGLPANEAEVRRMHAEGAADQKIADACGVAKTTVARWLMRLGLRRAGYEVTRPRRPELCPPNADPVIEARIQLYMRRAALGLPLFEEESEAANAAAG